MTPFQLYQWASSNIQSISLTFCTNEEYQSEKAFLEPRFDKSSTVPGTCGFIPISNETLSTKRYSFSHESKDQRVVKQDNEVEISDVSGYVLCANKSVWWLACVLEKDLENSMVKLTVLHPHGPSRSFRYPSIPDTVALPVSNILSLVNPRTSTGQTYTIQQKDSRIATARMKKFLS